MSRELKPRAWSKSHSAYCDFVTLDKIGEWIGWFERCGVYLADYDIILELPTGLKDMYGKKVYEGDITRNLVYDCNSAIEQAPSGAWMAKDDNGKTYEIIEDIDIVKVIGNIHENPELLEKK